MRLQKDVEGIRRWANSDTLLVLSTLRKTMGMDHDERFIFQSVHMLFEVKIDLAWGTVKIFIPVMAIAQPTIMADAVDDDQFF